MGILTVCLPTWVGGGKRNSDLFNFGAMDHLQGERKPLFQRLKFKARTENGEPPDVVSQEVPSIVQHQGPRRTCSNSPGGCDPSYANDREGNWSGFGHVNPECPAPSRLSGERGCFRHCQAPCKRSVAGNFRRDSKFRRPLRARRNPCGAEDPKSSSSPNSYSSNELHLITCMEQCLSFFSSNNESIVSKSALLSSKQHWSPNTTPHHDHQAGDAAAGRVSEEDRITVGGSTGQGLFHVGLSKVYLKNFDYCKRTNSLKAGNDEQKTDVDSSVGSPGGSDDSLDTLNRQSFEPFFDDAQPQRSKDNGFLPQIASKTPRTVYDADDEICGSDNDESQRSWSASEKSNNDLNLSSSEQSLDGQAAAGGHNVDFKSLSFFNFSKTDSAHCRQTPPVFKRTLSLQQFSANNFSQVSEVKFNPMMEQRSNYGSQVTEDSSQSLNRKDMRKQDGMAACFHHCPSDFCSVNRQTAGHILDPHPQTKCNSTNSHKPTSANVQCLGSELSIHPVTQKNSLNQPSFMLEDPLPSESLNKCTVGPEVCINSNFNNIQIGRKPFSPVDQADISNQHISPNGHGMLNYFILPHSYNENNSNSSVNKYVRRAICYGSHSMNASLSAKTNMQRSTGGQGQGAFCLENDSDPRFQEFSSGHHGFCQHDISNKNGRQEFKDTRFSDVLLNPGNANFSGEAHSRTTTERATSAGSQNTMSGLRGSSHERNPTDTPQIPSVSSHGDDFFHCTLLSHRPVIDKEVEKPSQDKMLLAELGLVKKEVGKLSTMLLEKDNQMESLLQFLKAKKSIDEVENGNKPTGSDDCLCAVQRDEVKVKKTRRKSRSFKRLIGSKEEEKKKDNGNTKGLPSGNDSPENSHVADEEADGDDAPDSEDSDCILESLCTSGTPFQTQQAIGALIRRLNTRKKRDKKIMEIEMKKVIDQRDSALAKCWKTEQQLLKLQRRCLHLPPTPNEEILKTKLAAVQQERDLAITKGRQLEDEIQTLRVFYSLQKSLADEAAQRDLSGSERLAVKPDSYINRSYQNVKESNGLLTQVRRLASENQQLLSDLQKARRENKATEAAGQR